MRVPQGEIAPGTVLIELHTHNERIPAIPQGGPDLAWAVRSRRLLESSLRRLAERLRTEACLRPVQGVVGASVLFAAEEGSASKRFIRRLGFSVLTPPERSTLGGLVEFWLNLHGWLIMWAYNRVSLRHRRLLRLHRSWIWMSREELLERWGRCP